MRASDTVNGELKPSWIDGFLFVNVSAQADGKFVRRAAKFRASSRPYDYLSVLTPSESVLV